MGPVEMLAISFPGSKFRGEILPALEDLVQRDLIRVIDLAIVTKDQDGRVRTLEVSELDDRLSLEPFVKDLEADGLIGQEDLELAAEELEPGSSAALFVWEDRWASPVANAIRNAGGVVLAHERIPPEAIDMLEGSAI